MEALNSSERKFAEENHGLIYSFLNYYSLPEAEYYDLCAIAYLRAVKDWHSKPELLQEAAEKEPDKLPKILIAENVKALGPYLPVLAAEYSRAGYKSYYQLFNSKWWGVPQNRERFIVVGIRDTLEGAYRYPAEQHEWIPKLSSVLEKDVPESFYIDDDKARKIIDQALQRLAKMGNVHAAITPDRVSKRQNGRRAKEDEEEMFALTAQDLHGVIQRQRKELVPPGDTCASALIHSRGLETRQDGISHCIKGGGGGSGANFLVEKVPPPITEVCVNDRGFTEKDPQVSSVAPTLRAENHGNHPKIIEERLTEVCVDNRNFRKKAMENGYGASVGVAPALLSSDYNGPKVVIEERSTPPEALKEP